MTVKKFEIVIGGVGGQGVLTLAAIIARAAMHEGEDVKAAELHGLAVRFGALQCHLRFGKKLYSPLVREGAADLIIATEPVEALRMAKYAGKKTVFLMDSTPIYPLYMYLDKERYPELKEITDALKPISKRVIVTDASKRAEELTGKTVAANTYLLGRAIAEDLIPVKKESVMVGMEEAVPERLLESNRKVFEAGFTDKH